MPSAMEDLLMCLLTIYVSSLEECLFRSYDHFLNWISCLIFESKVSYIFWIQVPYEIFGLQFFSPFVDSSHLLNGTLYSTKFLILVKSNLSFFSLLLLLLLVSYLKIHCLI